MYKYRDSLYDDLYGDSKEIDEREAEQSIAVSITEKSYQNLGKAIKGSGYTIDQAVEAAVCLFVTINKQFTEEKL